jgi:hypothetical protein
MRKCVQFLGLAAVLVAAVAILGLRDTARAAQNEISVGGVFVCNIAADASGYTANERAMAIQQRINSVLSTDSFRSNPNVFVRVQPAGSDALIWVGDKQKQILVFTVTPQDAAGSSVTPLQLAQQWAPKLAEGLGKAMPSAHWHMF